MSGKVASIMTALRDRFLSSSALDAWIKTIDASGTTTGNVFLGRRPQDNPDVSSNGPSVFIRRGRYSVLNQGAENTFTRELHMLVDIVWFEDYRASRDGTTEADFIDQLLDEMEAVGNSLATGFGGQFLGIETDDFFEQDEVERVVFHTEFDFSIWF